MAFDLMDVFVKIGADTGELESGISKAKGLASGLSGAISTGMKVAGAVIGTATAAVGGFAAASVKVGSTFDASMSQVAATMGTTVDQIEDLRQFAQEMGATTAFSATQAADALNYMALAGYDADTSMQMLPNVLNLAAAGSMELATASDMVTDAQTALGLSLEDTETLVDMMAKTSSKSNTSVQQLGDAILTIGGSAKSLAGGTTELNTVLGVLADNGIKGAEGGTHLRNAILALSAPTDTAAQMLTSLGVATTDAEGNLRPLEDIMGELSTSLDGLGSAEKDNIISTIFNKTDIAAVNALLDTSSERWDELSASIEDSSGAAEQMANTQLDNLEGDITLFKSALEGAQIIISDKLTPSLREFVQFGSNGITQIADGFNSGGLSGAMDAFSIVLSDGIGKVTEKLPEAVDAGMQLLGAIGEGVMSNAGVIGDALIEIGGQLITTAVDFIGGGAVDIVHALTDSLTANMSGGMIETGMNALMEFSGSLRTNVGLLVDAGLDMILALADGLIDNLPVFIQTVPTIITNIAGIINDNAPKLLVAGVELIGKLVAGIIQSVPTIIAEFPKIVQAIFAVITAVNWINLGGTIITGIVNGVKGFAANLPNALKSVGEKGVSILKSINWANLGQTMINLIVNGVRALSMAVPNALKAIGTAALNIFKSINWLQLGTYLVEGIWAGINDGGAWIKGKITEWVGDVLEFIKGLFGIHSPSRVMRDEVGIFLGKGVAVGILDSLPAVQDAMSSLTDLVESPNLDTTIQVNKEGKGITGTKSLYESEDNYSSLADAIVNAFIKAGIGIELDDREVGRIIRKAVAY